MDLVNVHTTAVVAHDGFRHEGGGFTEVVGNVLNHIFHVLGLIGAFNQSGETGTDFHLAAGADFGVMHFHFDAEFFQNIDHGRTQVLAAINRCNRGVTAFDGRAVAGVLTVQMQAA